MSMRGSLSRALMLLMLASITGCAAHRARSGDAPADAPRPQVQAETLHFSARPDPLLGTRAWNAESLFNEGEARYETQEFDIAIAAFRRVIDEFPDSRYVSPSTLLLGRSLLEKGSPQEALGWFDRYLEKHPDGSQLWFAWLGRGDAHAALERWAESEQDFGALLKVEGLSAARLDNARARLARAQVEQGELDEAEHLLRTIVTRRTPTTRLPDGTPDYYDTGALARFYLGEISRRRAEQMVLNNGFDLGKIEGDLEEKSRLTLEAHDHYYRTFAFHVPEWTAKAAYRMGYLYERFYQDLMSAPPPPELSPEDHALYLELLDEQLTNVIHKAIDLYQQVIKYADRLELPPQWVALCQEGIERLEARLQKRAASSAAHQASTEDTKSAETPPSPPPAPDAATPPASPR